MYTIKYLPKFTGWYRSLYTIIASILTIFVTLSLYSYHPGDPSCFYYTGANLPVHNWCGGVGAQCSALLFYLFGGASFVFVPILAFITVFFAQRRVMSDEWERLLALALFLVTSAGLLRAYTLDVMKSPYPGGTVGASVYEGLAAFLDPAIHIPLLLTFFMIANVLFFRFSFMPLIHYGVTFLTFVFTKIHEHKIVQRTAWLLVTCIRLLIVRPIVACLCFIRSLFDGSALQHTGLMTPEDHEDHGHVLENFYQQLQTQDSDKEHDGHVDTYQPSYESIIDHHVPLRTESENTESEITTTRTSKKQKIIKTKQELEQARYTLPNVRMFTSIDDGQDDNALTMELEERAHILEDKLKRFGVIGSVVAIKRGPVVTVFEYQPHIDTKLSKILSLEDDLAMALQALSIRIIAPIPGRSVVGFEVANKNRKNVMLASVIQTPAYQHYSGKLPLVLGQDTIGNTMIVDLTRMPHLLIAGSTGSGKSVALNAMLMSLLCKLLPDELKLILIDPKRLEFATYADIAHLLFPIVTDPRQAIPVLRWVVNEMERRYELIATHGTRNVTDYNEKVQHQNEHESLPSIVVIIDELADLMLTVGRDIEDLITRITQMARAAGIHMVVATQRPSVDVITGLIKANFPSRISFRVTSRIDSRTILDTMGADKLLGRGDMLFLDATTSQLKRVHGAYVSDHEIEQVVSHIRAEQKPSYLDIAQELTKESNELSNADDELYHTVLEFLHEVDEVSISLLQRKFRIGYNRSARIIDMLESQGLIMPPDGGKTRKVIR